MLPPDAIEPNETLDDLILGGMKMIQPSKGYRFSLDAVLLSRFAELKGVNRIIDIGTGNGIIPLLMSCRSQATQIIGVEIQNDMAQRALRNVQLNDKTAQITIIQQDIRKIEDCLPGGCAQLVLSNPPFWRLGEGKMNQYEEVAIARHEVCLELSQLVEKAAYLLEQKGRLAVIHRSDRMEELLQTLSYWKLQPRRMRFIHSFIDRKAKLVLLEGEKNGQGPLDILPPLIIYEQPGQYCQEIRAIYTTDE